MVGGAPDPPDPYETSAAQAAANREGAIVSGYMNNINTYTPFGSQTYKDIGTKTFTGIDGQQYEVPLRELHVNLSPDEQKKLNRSNNLQLGLLGLGNKQIDRVSDTLSKPLTFDGAVDRVTTLNGPQLQQSVNLQGPQMTLGNAGQIKTGFGPQGQLQSKFNTGGNVTGAYRDGGTINKNAPNLGQLATGFEGGGQLGNFASPVQGMSGTNPAYKESYAPADGFSADRARVSEGIMSRVNPQLQQSRQALESQLMAQGLQRGTAAFDRAMNESRQQQTDALIQADLAGGQEQSRLLGEARSAAGFTNDARARGFQDRAQANAQDFTQGLAGYNANMAAQQQRFGQNAVQAQFGNDAKLAQAQYGIQAMQARNAAQAQANQQNAQAAQFANQAQQQRYNQNLGAAQFANQTSLQGTDRQLQIREAQNAAQQQRYNQLLGAGTFANQATAQANQNTLAAAQFGNQAQQQQFANQAAAAGFQNDQRAAQIQEMLALRNQPLNEIGAFLGSGQVNIPQFQSMYRQGVQPPDVEGNVMAAYNAEANAAAQQNAGLFGMLGTGLSGLFALSDRRFKKDIRHIGATDAGVPLYTFRYIGGGPMQVGVMAQEARQIVPECVAEIGGILFVNYAKLR